MLKLSAVMVGLFVAFSAHAEDTSTGCGLGWKVTSKNSLVATTTRSTTNSYTMPFGITSGTSGCAKHSIVMKEKELIHYVESNFDGLAIDIAQGRGEVLNGLVQILGCNEESAGIFAKKAQGQFGEIYPKGGNPVIMIKGIVTTVEKDSTLSKTCRPNVG